MRQVEERVMYLGIRHLDGVIIRDSEASNLLAWQDLICPNLPILGGMMAIISGVW